MIKVNYLVSVREKRKIKVNSFLGKLYLKCLRRLIKIANGNKGPQIFNIYILDNFHVAVDLIIVNKLEEVEDTYRNLEYTQSLSEEEIAKFSKEFKKYLGVKLTVANSELREQWIPIN